MTSADNYRLVLVGEAGAIERVTVKTPHRLPPGSYKLVTLRLETADS